MMSFVVVVVEVKISRPAMLCNLSARRGRATLLPLREIYHQGGES